MNIINITLENAKEFLIDESFKRPVLIDFWAEWSAPCKTLRPLLEKLANEFAGAFLLASVDADKLGAIAGQFGVQNVPVVMLMKDGQPIDGFSGAVPEAQVRELLKKHLPAPWEQPLAEAKALMAAGDHSAALPLLRRAYDESKHVSAIAYLLVECNLQLNRLDNAEQILSTVKMVDQDSQYQRLLAQLELKKQAAKTPQLIALEEAYAAEPNNLEICYQLALQYSQESAYRLALELLIKIVRSDKNFGNGLARKTLTDLLVALGKGDPLAIEFQRKLFTLLY